MQQREAITQDAYNFLGNYARTFEQYDRGGKEREDAAVKIKCILRNKNSGRILLRLVIESCLARIRDSSGNEHNQLVYCIVGSMAEIKNSFGLEYDFIRRTEDSIISVVKKNPAYFGDPLLRGFTAQVAEKREAKSRTVRRNPIFRNRSVCSRI